MRAAPALIRRSRAGCAGAHRAADRRQLALQRPPLARDRASARRPFEPTGRGVELDRTSRNVWVDGNPVELAAKEFELLAYLVDHPQRACTRSELLSAVWASHAGWQTEATVTATV